MREPIAQGIRKHDPAISTSVPFLWEQQADERHVSLCLAHGGFVRAVAVRGATVWICPDGTQWRSRSRG